MALSGNGCSCTEEDVRSVFEAKEAETESLASSFLELLITLVDLFLI